MNTKENKEKKDILNAEERELNLEEMEQVAGGGLRDVYYEQTKEIDESIKERV